ncbi:MAG: JAB domain-containing protein [Verrucomicrobia bacterium]|nr:JAB domain-containing protein [Verrucomicrobiota bacterium]
MTGRIKDMPAAERPRERLVARGADALTSAELVAILLRTGLKGKSAIEVGNELLGRHGGSVDALCRASLDELQDVPGVGRDKAVTLKAAFTLARRLAEERNKEAPLMDTPDRIASAIREEFRETNVERFCVVLLNTRRRFIKSVPLAHGTLDTLLVHAREVFRPAIAANAASIVLVHNHPSGDPMPSEADIKVTRDLIRAGQLLKIEVLDHVIIGRGTTERTKDYTSLRELGYFYA